MARHGKAWREGQRLGGDCCLDGPRTILSSLPPPHLVRGGGLGTSSSSSSSSSSMPSRREWIWGKVARLGGFLRNNHRVVARHRRWKNKNFHRLHPPPPPPPHVPCPRISSLHSAATIATGRGGGRRVGTAVWPGGPAAEEAIIRGGTTAVGVDAEATMTMTERGWRTQTVGAWTTMTTTTTTTTTMGRTITITTTETTTTTAAAAVLGPMRVGGASPDPPSRLLPLPRPHRPEDRRPSRPCSRPPCTSSTGRGGSTALGTSRKTRGGGSWRTSRARTTSRATP